MAGCRIGNFDVSVRVELRAMLHLLRKAVRCSARIFLYRAQGCAQFYGPQNNEKKLTKSLH